MTQRCVRVAALGLMFLALWPSRLPAQERPPYTVDELVQLIESGVFSDARIMTLARESCLGFQPDESVTSRLRDAGASEELLAGLRSVCVSVPRVVVAVRIVPTELDIAVDDVALLSAEALGADSATIPDIIFAWSSDDTTVVAVSRDGRLEGRAPGTARVTARLEDGPSAFATVSVTEVVTAGVKSPATAAALGIIPGGGEIYVGNTAKGIGALVGAGAALAIGFAASSETVLNSTADLTDLSCVGEVCTFSFDTEAEVEETSYALVGVAVAGAIWALALVDGILTAKRSQAAAQSTTPDEASGLAVRFAPTNGVRVRWGGDVDVTLIRVRL